MQACVGMEQRFLRLPDGTVWTQSGFTRPFWDRYLDVFDHVQCVARIRDVTRLDGEWERADGPCVSFTAVPHYIGPGQFVRQVLQVRRAIREAVQPGQAYVLRVPGAISSLIWRELHASGYPFGLEIVGDPYDVFAPGAVRHPLRPLLRWYGTRQLRRQCREASAASYVTKHSLQRRYPSPAPAVNASCIGLYDDAFVAQPRAFGPVPATRLVFVGSLEQYYKAPDVLIASVALGVRRGLDLHLTIVGEGRLRPALEALASKLGCAGRIRFAGHLTGAVAVRRALDAADLFVLPSRTEGLPRAMIEAMARGLPCIGSSAGGIPELLPPEAIVPPGDADALLQRIRDVISDPARMNRMSAANMARAKEYLHDVLLERRLRVYQEVRRATEIWLSAERRTTPASPSFEKASR